MSFAAEMRDFMSAFKATSSIAGDVRDRLDKKKNTFDPNSVEFGGIHDPGIQPSKGKKSKTPPSQINAIFDKYVPKELRPYAEAMAYHESRYNPSAVSPTGATGLFQFTGGTWAKTTGMSLGPHTDGRRDPALNTQAFVKLTEANRDGLKKVLGREPTFGELALAHQQGLGGATYLLTGKAPKGLDPATVERNLAHNNVKARGRDAASQIASFYGFDLGEGSPATSTAAAVPVPQTEAKPKQAIAADEPAYDDGDGDGDGADSEDAADAESEGMDVSAIQVPEGAKRYSPDSLTDTPDPTMFAADGGAVPWAGATSQVASRSALPTYRPTNTAAVQPKKAAGDGNPANKGFLPPWGSDTMKYITDYQSQFAPSYVARMNDMYNDMVAKGWKPKDANSFINSVGFSSLGGLFFNGRSHQKGDAFQYHGFQLFADGGVVDDEAANAPNYNETTASKAAIPAAPVTSPGKANRDTVPQAEAPVGYNAKNDVAGPRQKGITAGQALHTGLTYLNHVHGLDQNAAAVGDDPDLQNRQRKVVNGAIGPNEGPPSDQEVQQIYQVVDPNGELTNGLKTVYAMQKGVEFYLSRGDVDKAGKWAAGLIQYSNLLSRRYGYEAVQAGKQGDMDGMVKYAIKAYESIPDGMEVEATRKGNGVEVTRTDEDGQVVDKHLLSPQQIFQMATGISQGSGYFEALMSVASPKGKGSDLAERRFQYQQERDAKADARREDYSKYRRERDDAEDAWREDQRDYMRGRDAKRDDTSEDDRKYRRERDAKGDASKEEEKTYRRERDAKGDAVKEDDRTYKRERDAKGDASKEEEKTYRRGRDEKSDAEKADDKTYKRERDAKGDATKEEEKTYKRGRDEKSDAWKTQEANRNQQNFDKMNGFEPSPPITGITGGQNQAIPTPPQVTPQVTSQSKPSLKPAPSNIMDKARAAIARKGRAAVVKMLEDNGYSAEGL